MHQARFTLNESEDFVIVKGFLVQCEADEESHLWVQLYSDNEFRALVKDRCTSEECVLRIELGWSRTGQEFRLR